MTQTVYAKCSMCHTRTADADGLCDACYDDRASGTSAASQLSDLRDALSFACYVRLKRDYELAVTSATFGRLARLIDRIHTQVLAAEREG